MVMWVQIFYDVYMKCSQIWEFWYPLEVKSELNLFKEDFSVFLAVAFSNYMN